MCNLNYHSTHVLIYSYIFAKHRHLRTSFFFYRFVNKSSFLNLYSNLIGYKMQGMIGYNMIQLSTSIYIMYCASNPLHPILVNFHDCSTNMWLLTPLIFFYRLYHILNYFFWSVSYLSCMQSTSTKVFFFFDKKRIPSSRATTVENY